MVLTQDQLVVKLLCQVVQAEEQVKKDFMYFVKIAEKVRVVAALPTSAFGHEFVTG